MYKHIIIIIIDVSWLSSIHLSGIFCIYLDSRNLYVCLYVKSDSTTRYHIS